MMDNITQFLKEEGWYLTTEAVNKISDNGSISNIKVLISKALNLDLREIGSACFPEDITKGKLESIPGNIVVQIQKVRNVSAPKANEESRGAPRMLKVALTDGHFVCQAVELEPLTSLSLNTPPGTKLLLKGETLPLSHGMLLLQPSTTQVLGGIVPQLIEKWELHRSLAKHTRGRVGEEGGPPPWIPFGQKIVRPSIQDRNFKSLDDGRDNKENAEFEAQRKDAIAEAARGVAKKVFGGGNARSLVDKNVKQIVEMGFTLDQAEQALQQARNNVNRALRILQKKEVSSGGGTGSGGGRGGRRRGGGDREDDSGVGAGGGGGGSGVPKPSGKVSLFDYLEDKLPTQNEKENESHDYNQSGHSHYQYLGNSNSTQKSSYNTSSYNHRGGNRHDGSGHKSRGGHNSGSDSRQSREDRNQNQKPPRFQNQHRYQESNSYQNWSYNNNNVNIGNDFAGYDGTSVSVPVRGNYTNTRAGRSGHDVSYSDNYNRPRHQSNHISTYNANDYNRSSRRYDNSGGVNSGGGIGSGSANTYRNSSVNSDNFLRQLIEAGMPEIPEFPFKDASVIPSLMSTGTFTEQSSLRDVCSILIIIEQTGALVRKHQGVHRYVLQGFYPPAGFNNNQPQHQTHQHPVPPPSTQYSGGGIGGKVMHPVVEQNPAWQWKVGDKCMAKYWEDNVYYDAEVTGLSKKTCVVRFLEYGNFEEVLQDDCIPISEDIPNSAPPDQSLVNSAHHNPGSGGNRFSGILEFRRGGTRPYIKSSDTMDRNHRKSQPRGSQPMYIPPAQRKEPSSAYK